MGSNQPFVPFKQVDSRQKWHLSSVPFRDLQISVCGVIHSLGGADGCKCLVAFLLLGLNLAWLRKEIFVAIPATPYAQTLGSPWGWDFDTTWPGGGRRLHHFCPAPFLFSKTSRSSRSDPFGARDLPRHPTKQPTCIRSKSYLSARFWRFRNPCRVVLRRRCVMPIRVITPLSERK